MLANVRFGVKSRHCASAQANSPLCANSGNVAPYSITSSAVDNKLGETVSPSVFATLRLITNSNLFASSTGSSLGFSPLRIRPV